jgi:hypothetical protein
MIERTKIRKIFKGFDNELGWEITWTVYNVEDLTAYEQNQMYLKMNEMISYSHPNVLKYMYAFLNKNTHEILVITEIASCFKHYLKKLGTPKLKIITNWCTQILDGLEFLFSKCISRVNLSSDWVYSSEEGDVKIGDLVIDSKFKSSHRFFKKKHGNIDPDCCELLTSDPSSTVFNFGKLVLYMVVHTANGYKNALRIVKSGNKEILFDKIKNDDLRDFLKKCLGETRYENATQLRAHQFLRWEHNDSKEYVDEDFLEFLENRKLKKKDTDVSSVWKSTVFDEESKSFYGVRAHGIRIQPFFVLEKLGIGKMSNIHSVLAKTSHKLKKKKVKGKKKESMMSKSHTKSKSKFLPHHQSMITSLWEENIPNHSEVMNSMLNEGASIIKHKKKKVKKIKNADGEKGKTMRKRKRRLAQTNINIKDKLPKSKSKIKPEDWKSRIEKTYKEDSTDHFAIKFNSNSPMNRLVTNNLKLMKNKSLDDRKRLKIIKKIKSMKIKDPNLFMDEPIFLKNLSPNCGRNLDSVLNKTLSLLWNTQLNICSSPMDNLKNLNKIYSSNKIIVPMKLTIEKNEKVFEISFDYDMAKDTPSGVANELKQAIKLSEKHANKIARRIKKTVLQIESLIELLRLIKKRESEFKLDKLNISSLRNECKDSPKCSVKDEEQYNSFPESIPDKYQFFWIPKKPEMSFIRLPNKLLPTNVTTVNR